MNYPSGKQNNQELGKKLFNLDMLWLAYLTFLNVFFQSLSEYLDTQSEMYSSAVFAAL